MLTGDSLRAAPRASPPFLSHPSAAGVSGCTVAQNAHCTMASFPRPLAALCAATSMMGGLRQNLRHLGGPANETNSGEKKAAYTEGMVNLYLERWWKEGHP